MNKSKTISAHVTSETIDQPDLTRTLLNHRHRLLQQKMSTQGDRQWLDTLETEDDILNAASKLTKRNQDAIAN